MYEKNEDQAGQDLTQKLNRLSPASRLISDALLRSVGARETMTPEVFEGASGHLIICQEWPALEETSYLRIMVSMVDARKLANEILAIAENAEKHSEGKRGAN
jgi:hypothetical protein